LLILFFLLISAVQAFSTSDSTRRLNIEAFNSSLAIAPLLKYRYPSLEINGPDPEHRRIVYRPNNSYNAGARLFAFGFTIEASAAISPGSRSIGRYGETDASELTINTMGKRWFGDLHWVNYKGLFLRKSWESYSAAPALPLRPDLSLLSRTGSVTFLFNPNRFSMRSPYLFSERQLYSAGSPLLRVAFNRFSFSGSGTMLNPEDLPYFEELDKVAGTSFFMIGLAPGYSYNYIWRDFFVNGTLTAGPAQYWIRNQQISGGTTYDIQINFVTSIGLAAGYNGRKFFGGLSYRSQGFRLKLSETTMNGDQNVLVLMGGIRFLRTQ